MAFIYDSRRLPGVIMPTTKSFKTYTLDDLREITAPELAKQANIHIKTARNRLNRSTDPKELFKEATNANNKGCFKTYTLDDGSQWTIPQMAAETGLTRQAIASRIYLTKDPEKVLSKKRQIHGFDVKRISAEMQERMFFDPLGHWALFNKAS